jgi:hypothetical protein
VLIMAITILPNIGQRLGQTRDPIRINFQTINTGFSVNHVTLDLADPDSGKHKSVVFPAVAPAVPAHAAGEIGLYPSLLNGINQLYVQRQAVADAPIPVTVLGQSPIPFVPGHLTTGYCYLPCGLLVKWGRYYQAAPVAGLPVVITFPVAPAFPNFPAFTEVYQILTQPLNIAALYSFVEDGALAPRGIDPTFFSINWQGAYIPPVGTMINLSYIAFGKP